MSGREGENGVEAGVASLAEHARDLLYRYRFAPAPGFEYVSPSCTAMTGYTPEDHYADPELGLKLVHPEDRAKLATPAECPPSAPMIIRWITRDGRVLWTEHTTRFLRDAAGAVVGIEGIARDVSDRARAEEALRGREALLRRALQAGGHEHWEHDLAADRLLAGDPFAVLERAEPWDVPLTEAWRELIAPEDLPPAEEAWRALLAGRTATFAAEFRARHADGGLRRLLVRGRVVERAADGRPLRAVGTVTDVTGVAGGAAPAGARGEAA